MFDKTRNRPASDAREPSDDRIGPEDERIALRCNRRELQLMDSFVADGEFRTRSELMREALRSFLRDRAMSAVVPAAEAGEIVEVPVRLRREEVAMLIVHAKLVGNDRPLGDLLAELVRVGEMQGQVADLVQRHSRFVHEAAAARAQVEALGKAGQRLKDRGFVGR
ncbi:MAG: ribbon-helix-helix domain-containing protein [Thermoplasmata archaeon]|nr:ribbon-helix-helix domain-containing protein [Thermoplasmata archaeon]